MTKNIEIFDVLTREEMSLPFWEMIPILLDNPKVNKKGKGVVFLKFGSANDKDRVIFCSQHYFYANKDNFDTLQRAVDHWKAYQTGAEKTVWDIELR